MIVETVAVDVTIGMLMDGAVLSWVCSTNDCADLVGHGATADEAIEDLRCQYEAIVWH